MEKQFVKFATATAKLAGKPWTFIGCLAIVLVWALSGPVFGFSANWQLVINTGTTIITFLMVFLIQNTQNRDGAAMQAKLDELLFAVKQADDRFIGIEHLTVPMGFDRGMPVGISFIGGKWDDARILSLGHAYEQRTHERRPPPPPVQPS